MLACKMYAYEKEEKLSMSERQARKLRKKTAEEPAKKNGKGSAGGNAVIALVVAAFIGLGAYAVASNYKAKNPTDDSVQQSQTVAQYAEEKGITTEEFIAQYGLEDSDVNADTDINTAVSEMTVEGFAEFSEKSVDEIKEEYSLGDEVTADMNWTDAQGYIPIGVMVQNMGMEYSDFLSNYSLTEEELPEDTIWNDAMSVLQEASEKLSEQNAAEAE